MLIGITGFSRSGKSAVGQILQSRNFCQTAFAAPLKEMLLALGCSAEQVYGTEKEIPSDLLCGKTPRYAMQMLGTEWRDLIHPELWSRIWSKRVRELLAGGIQHIFVDDLRFLHEVKAVSELSGMIWRINRPGIQQAYNHASEALISVLPVDHQIENDGSLEKLRATVLDLLYSAGEAVL